MKNQEVVDSTWLPMKGYPSTSVADVLWSPLSSLSPLYNDHHQQIQALDIILLYPLVVLLVYQQNTGVVCVERPPTHK